MRRVPLVSAVLWSAVTGAIVFGVGGRIAMRVYALREWHEPYFTATGTLTVVAIATLAGAATGGWLWLARRLFPVRRVARHVFFWAGLILLSLWVLTPISRSRLEVFSPLVAMHGVALHWLTRRSLTARQA